VAMLYAFPYFLAFSHPSYHYPLEPFLMVFSSTFFVGFVNGMPEVSWERISRHKAGIAAALVVFGLIQVEFLVIMARQWV